MELRLFTFSKPTNSTKIPQTSPVSIIGVLKEHTDVINPVFEINMAIVNGLNTAIAKYNYLYCPEFNRYYHITNWAFDIGVWQAHCHVDVLATWKGVIGASSQLISRSSKYGLVDDMMKIGKIDPKYTRRALNSIFVDSVSSSEGIYTNNIGNGVYIVTMAGKPDASGSGIMCQNTYCMTLSEFLSFRTELSTTAYTSISAAVDDITDNVAKVLINPFQYIIRCFYLPIARSTLFPGGYSSVHVRYGWYTLNTQAALVTDPVATKNLYNSSIPFHPNYSASAALNRVCYAMPRWSTYSIEYRFIGKVMIPNEKLINNNKLYIYATIDMYSGFATIWGWAAYTDGSTETSEPPFVIAQQNWAIEIPISSYLRDPYAATDAVANTSQGIGNILKDVATLNAGGVIDDINNMYHTATGMTASMEAATVQMLGGIGSLGALIYPNNGLVLEYIEPINENCPTIGNATAEYGVVSSYANATGTPYIIMCTNPTLQDDASGTPWLSSEYDEIISYMTNGFYYR